MVRRHRGGQRAGLMPSPLSTPCRRAKTRRRCCPAWALRSKGVASTMAAAPRAQLESSHRSNSTGRSRIHSGRRLARLRRNAPSQCCHSPVPSPATRMTSGSKAAIAGAIAWARRWPARRENFARPGVAAVGQASELGEAVAGLQHTGRAAGGDKPVSSYVGLEAAPLAARAQWPVARNDDMAQLARSAFRTPLEDAVRHTRKPDPSPDSYDHEAPPRLAAPEQVLGHGKCLDIILDQDGHAKRPAQPAAHWHRLPAQDISVDVANVGPRDYAGHADPHTEQVLVAGQQEDLQARQQLVEGIGGQGVKRLGPRGNDLAIKAHVHKHDVIGGQLHPDGAAGAPDEPQQLAGTATFGGREVKRLDDALVDQAPGHLANRGRGKVELTGDGRS